AAWRRACDKIQTSLMEIFPTPDHLLASVASWRPEARAELKTHLGEHHLTLGRDSEAELRTAERQVAKRTDSRVDEALALRFGEVAREAQRLIPQQQRFGCAFTRLIDAKFRLDASALQALVEALLGEAGPPDQLWGAVEEGPSSGETAWPRPSSHTELVASL